MDAMIRRLVEDNTKLNYPALCKVLLERFGITGTIRWDTLLPAPKQQQLLGNELLQLVANHPSMAGEKEVRDLTPDQCLSCCDIIYLCLADNALPRAQVAQLVTKVVRNNIANQRMIWFFGNPQQTLCTVVLSQQEGSKIFLKTFSFHAGGPYYTTHESILASVKAAMRPVATANPAERWKTVWQAIDLAVVHKSFYKEVKQAFTVLVRDELTTARSLFTDDTAGAQFALRLLSRLLVCWFLKRKGTLDDTLLSAQAVQQHSNYYREVLEPLFFDVFNTPLSKRTPMKWPEAMASCPHLPGSLLKEQRADYRSNPQLHISNTWFEHFFTNILERYYFILEENSSSTIEIAIDPEMLGRVFENLLADQPARRATPGSDRKSTGSFYTPRLVVDYMVELSIAEYLRPFFTPSLQAALREFVISAQLSEQLQKSRNELTDLLNKVKVLDPACGSGAFLMGMLQKLTQLKTVLDPQRSAYEVQLETVRQSIYGVDIQPMAIALTRLRCWLSLIAADKGPLLKPLPDLWHTFIAATAVVTTGVEDGIRKARKMINGFSAAAPGLAVEWDPFDDTTAASFFSKTWMFGVEEGFDIVIANPPYMKEYINRTAFDGVRTSPYYQGKMDLWYLFACEMLDNLKPGTGILAFIATNNWVTNAGASKFRNKLVTDGQLLQLVDFGGYKIFERAGVQTMVLLCKRNDQLPEYFFEYSKVPGTDMPLEALITLLTNRQPSIVQTSTPAFDRIQLRDKTFLFNERSYEDILEMMEARSNFKLDGETEIAQGIVPNPHVVTKKLLAKIPVAIIKKHGIQTGDGVFVIRKDHLTSLTATEQQLLKPLWEPNELARFYVPDEHAGHIIYFTKQDDPREVPAIMAHLQKYRTIMEDRRETRNGYLQYYHLHWPRDKHFFEAGPKILGIRKCLVPTFSYTEAETYVMMAINVIRSSRISGKYLTALLNSTPIAFWLKHRGKMQGTHYQVDKEPLINLPLQLINDTSVFEHLVDYIIFLGRHPGLRVSQLAPNEQVKQLFETVLNGCVCELYFEAEMKNKELTILQDCRRLFQPVHTMHDHAAISARIAAVYEALEKPGNEIRQRINLFAAASPRILRPVQQVYE